MDLYLFPPAPGCLKVIALAHHLKLRYTLHSVNVPRGEHKAREFLELNRNGRVPLLVDGPLKLWESDAILWYLAEKAGGSLLPGNAFERADMLRWMFWQCAHFGPACGVLIYENVAKPVLNLGVPDPAEIRRGAEETACLLRVLEQHFEELDYACAHRLTIADFSLAAWCAYWREAGLPLAAHPRVLAWHERIMALPAWQEALHHKPRMEAEAHSA
jgi:glutathione S-transferase